MAQQTLTFSELSYIAQCDAVDDLFAEEILTMDDYQETGLTRFKTACADAGIKLDIHSVSASVESLSGDDFINTEFTLSPDPCSVSDVEAEMKHIMTPVVRAVNDITTFDPQDPKHVVINKSTPVESYPESIRDAVKAINTGIYNSMKSAGEEMRDPEAIAEFFDDKYPDIRFSENGSIA